MKKWFKVSVVMIFALLATVNTNAQNNGISIQAEQVDGGVKVMTTENGSTSEFVVNLAEAEAYIKQFGGSIDFNINETGDNSYLITYDTEYGNTQKVEIDLGSLLENLSIDVSDITEDLKSIAKEIASQVEYEESVDENGDKAIKITSRTAAE